MSATWKFAGVFETLISAPIDQYPYKVLFFHAWNVSRPVPSRYSTVAPSSEAQRSAPFTRPVNFRRDASGASTPLPAPLGALLALAWSRRSIVLSPITSEPADDEMASS